MPLSQCHRAAIIFAGGNRLLRCGRNVGEDDGRVRSDLEFLEIHLGGVSHLHGIVLVVVVLTEVGYCHLFGKLGRTREVTGLRHVGGIENHKVARISRLDSR